MSKKTINLKGDIVKGYLDKIMAQEGGRITIFKLTLAKKIYNENKAVFKNVEDVSPSNLSNSSQIIVICCSELFRNC